jgi:hypothetical protein
MRLRAWVGGPEVEMGHSVYYIYGCEREEWNGWELSTGTIKEFIHPKGVGDVASVEMKATFSDRFLPIEE